MGGQNRGPVHSLAWAEGKGSVLKEQAKIPPENVLVRDLDGEGDTPLRDEHMVDLAEGNVFYAVPPCEAPNGGGCHKGPKLAFFVDDRPEETLRADQTGKTLRDLLSFTPEVLLFRDYESPHDQPVGLDDTVNFADGPVFYTRRKHKLLTIFVNEKPFTEDDGVKHEMTGSEIAKLVFDDSQNYDVYKLPGDEEIKANQKVHIHDCEKFKVIRKTVTGGYELARIERELDTLRQSGAKVTFVPEVPGIVYHDIPARKDYPHLQATDVLVTVPGGYPGQPLDGAFLPKGSRCWDGLRANRKPTPLPRWGIRGSWSVIIRTLAAARRRGTRTSMASIPMSMSF